MFAFMMRLSRLMAYAGGIVLSLLILITCLSILGRAGYTFLNSEPVQAAAPGVAAWLLSLGVGPIRGDFELVEAGMAFAIFAFLPLTQISGAHAVVDVFTNTMSPRSNAVLRWIADMLFAVAIIVITVQLASGTQSKISTGQTTFLLEFPVWWSYALSLVGAALAMIVSVYIAFERTRELVTGKTILPAGAGADH